MAEQAAQEELLDIRVAEASSLYKFYLNQEKEDPRNDSRRYFPHDLGANRQHAATY